jgi:hypothetical protein
MAVYRVPFSVSSLVQIRGEVPDLKGEEVILLDQVRAVAPFVISLPSWCQQVTTLFPWF